MSMLDAMMPYMPTEQAALSDGRRLARTAWWRASYRGMDMFDCVLATRIARNGTVLHPSTGGWSSETRSYARQDFGPGSRKAATATPAGTSPAAYIRHLIKAGEITRRDGWRAIHNLRYLLRLMERIRKAIEEDRYEEFRSEFFSHYDMSRNF